MHAWGCDVMSKCIKHTEWQFPGRACVFMCVRKRVHVSPQPEQNPLDHSRALWHPAIVTFTYYLAVMGPVQLMSVREWESTSMNCCVSIDTHPTHTNTQVLWHCLCRCRVFCFPDVVSFYFKTQTAACMWICDRIHYSSWWSATEHYFGRDTLETQGWGEGYWSLPA